MIYIWTRVWETHGFFLLFGLQGLAKLSGVLVGRLDLISRVYDTLYAHLPGVLYSVFFFSFFFFGLLLRSILASWLVHRSLTAIR